MNEVDNIFLMQLISDIIGKSTYIKYLDKDEYLNNEDFYQGAQFAYHKVLDSIKEKLKIEGFNIDNFGLDFNINEICNYKPESL